MSLALKTTTSLFFRNYRTVAIFCVVLGIASCGSEDDKASDSGAKTAPRIEVVKVVAKPLQTKRTWQGTLEPLRTYEIVAPENGRVDAFRLDVGEEVTAGDIVVEMRFPDSAARRSELAERVKQLETEKQRLSSLAKGRAVSDAAVAIARIALLQAQAELRGIEAQLAEGKILAPANGWVLETAAVAGSSVVEGAILARMADASSLGVRFQIPNTEIRYFEHLSNLKVEDEAGKIHDIKKTIRQGESIPNVTRVELWLDAKMQSDVGAVSVRYESSRDALSIPWSAVATDDDRAWVGLLDGDNRIKRRDVSLGETSGTRVEVVEGLNDGDMVVLYQPRSQGEGSKIEPVLSEKTIELGE